MVPQKVLTKRFFNARQRSKRLQSRKNMTTITAARYTNSFKWFV